MGGTVFIGSSANRLYIHTAAIIIYIHLRMHVYATELHWRIVYSMKRAQAFLRIGYWVLDIEYRKVIHTAE